jgi:hypothetical protein
MTETGKPAGDMQTYFEAIEDTFIRLRGAPLLLSPTDWQVANEWYEAGIPLATVSQTLEEVFARRKERGGKGRIQSLRYCSEAVLKAWEETSELEAGGGRQRAIAVDVQARLSCLADSLPDTLGAREEWVGMISSLSGSSDEVERTLTKLDSELLEAAERSLTAEDREQLSDRVDAVLSSLQDRLPEEEIEAARERIWRGVLREVTQLPLLSLFSPEALTADRDSSS